MNKHILKYFTLCTIAVLLSGCNDGESDLLEPKIYFEDKEFVIEVEDEISMTYDLQTRISSLHSSSVEVLYTIADASVIDAYNEMYETNYKSFNAADVNFSKKSVIIPQKGTYSEKSVLKLSNLNEIKGGEQFLLPIRIESPSMPTMDRSDIFYFVIKKPVDIMQVAHFNSNAVRVPLIPGNLFTSLTYEALIYMERLGGNNTIMGCEGILILRIGDLTLPASNLIQIAGRKEFYSTHKFETKKWYHVAFTYDQPSGKAIIYINGEKATESIWDTPSFDLSTQAGGFFIGKVAGFMWGERPFYGYMSEVRLWNTSRTEKQLKQNMFYVDPKTKGLAFYYKLTGDDQFKDGSTWYIKDASGNEMNGLANRGYSPLNFKTLDKPIRIK